MRLLALAMLVGCSSSSEPAGGDDTPGDPPLDPAVTRVTFEIDYETGQEPFTGPILGFGDTFDVSVANFNRLLANKKTLTLPTMLAQMEDIGPSPTRSSP